MTTDPEGGGRRGAGEDLPGGEVRRGNSSGWLGKIVPTPGKRILLPEAAIPPGPGTDRFPTPWVTPPRWRKRPVPPAVPEVDAVPARSSPWVPLPNQTFSAVSIR